MKGLAAIIGFGAVPFCAALHRFDLLGLIWAISLLLRTDVLQKEINELKKKNSQTKEQHEI